MDISQIHQQLDITTKTHREAAAQARLDGWSKAGLDKYALKPTGVKAGIVAGKAAQRDQDVLVVIAGLIFRRERAMVRDMVCRRITISAPQLASPSSP